MSTATMHRSDDALAMVRAEDHYDTSPDDLWQACTDPERLERWIAQVDGDVRLGGLVEITFTSSYTGTFRVDACEAPRHLLLTEQAGELTMQLELWISSEGDGARLVIEDRGLPLEEVHEHAAGWQVHLDDLTRALAAGATAHPSGWSSERPSPDWAREWQLARGSYAPLEG
ncbi:SRPBCC domain-containing protein [Aestuariimicrobium soli]|uniref:SRPBCC domain-containing protein n=1 Tax=Aestuariimicrobium soli TaxID=2035834 RepID=UPI003EB99F81